MKTKNQTILVVEDDEASREFLSEVLDSLGYNFISTQNGIEGLELFKLHSPSLVLLDIRLPDINGIEVLNRIKKLSPETPVIAQTAFAMEPEKEEFLRNGFDGYLSKPIKPEVLAETIKKYIGLPDKN